MPDQVPEQKKTERSNILLSLEKKMSEEFRNYYAGKEKTGDGTSGGRVFI